LWRTSYNGTGNSSDEAAGIAVRPDGSMVFVTGASYSSTGNTDFATVAYDAANGAVSWKARFAGPAGGNDAPVALAVSPDGTKVYVSGTRYGGPDNDTMDYQTFAYNAATGATVWASRYNGGWDDYGSTLAVAPNGSSVFVTGASYDGTTFFNKTVAYGAGRG